MDAPIREIRQTDEFLPADLTAEEAIARWRDRRKASLPQPEPLLAAGELHGVMPRPRAKPPSR